jgi:hypothetical protein
MIIVTKWIMPFNRKDRGSPILYFAEFFDTDLPCES